MSVPLYKQTTEYTCGPSSVMMVLKHFGKIKHMSKELENEIWQESRTFPFLPTSPHGLAKVLAGHKLDVTVIRKVKLPTKYEFECFSNFEEIPESMKEETLKVFNRNNKTTATKAKKLGVKFVMDSPSINAIREHLGRGELVIALIGADYFHKHHWHYNKGQVIPHWIVLTAFDEFIHVNDPTAGNIRFSPEELDGMMKLLDKRFKIKPALIFVGKR